MAKLIISDFDGVIADSKYLIYLGYNNFFREFGYPEMTFDEFNNFYSVDFYKNYEKLNVPDDRLEEAVNLVGDYCEDHADQIPLFHDVVKVYESLKQPLAIATSGSYDYVYNKIKDLPLWDKIEYVAHAFSVKNIKPSPESIKQCLDFTRISAKDAVYIGDTVIDVIAGKAAKVSKVIAVSWGFEEKEILELAKPDYIADDAKELENILRQV